MLAGNLIKKRRVGFGFKVFVLMVGGFVISQDAFAHVRQYAFTEQYRTIPQGSRFR